MNTNFKVIGLTRLGIKPKSTDPEADALTTPPSELYVLNSCVRFFNRKYKMLSHHKDNKNSKTAVVRLPFVRLHVDETAVL